MGSWDMGSTHWVRSDIVANIIKGLVKSCCHQNQQYHFGPLCTTLSGFLRRVTLYMLGFMKPTPK